MGRKVVGGYNGRAGKVVVRGVELCVTKWDATETADEEETTNTCSGGYAEFEYGNKMLEGSVEADFDAARNFFDNPPLIRAGEKFPAVFFFESSDGVTGPHIQIGEIGVSNVKMGGGAKGKSSYSFDWKSSSSYQFNAAEESSGA